MRRWLPILALIAGLGSLISSAKTAVAQATPPVPAQATASPPEEVDPFSRYVEFESAHRREPALSRFAGACGIDLASAKPRYAQRPGDTWNIVPDLSRAKDDQETDFYGTVELWQHRERILVELWSMELDTGGYDRSFVCLDKKQITLAESTSWNMAGFGDTADDISWGFEHRWKLSMSGQFETAGTRFVDLKETTIPDPKLSAEILTALQQGALKAKTWADLELPGRLLQ